LNPTERLIFDLIAVFALGVGAHWLAWRLKVPSILLLLIAGFAAGPFTGWLDPDALLGDLLMPFVSISVAVILFEGGTSLRLRELREIGGSLQALLTIGVLITWLLITAAAAGLLQLPMREALLLGAVLVVTGPTVVGPLLMHIRPIGKVGSLARWEGIFIDPIGAALAVLVYGATESIHPQMFWPAAGEIGLGLLWTLSVALVVGGVCGLVLIEALRRHWIPDFLQSPIALGTVLAAFALSNHFQDESGLLTATVMGLILANQRSVAVEHITQFKENLRVLLIAGLFVLLAARVQPADFTQFGWGGVLFVAALILVVRPVAVLLSTLPTRLTWPERLFLCWLAPRGIVAAAVASVFALRLGAPGQQLVPITFLVILSTVSIYGLTASWVARRLGLAVPNPQGVLIAGASDLARAIAQILKREGFEALLVDTNRAHIQTARMEGLACQHASILSEQSQEELDLGGIGRFLGLTPNDELNSLAALHFRKLFGRAQVYQLPPPRSNQRTQSAAGLVYGRLLFAPEATYEVLEERLRHGGVIKATRLSEQFDYEQFREHSGDDVLLLFVVGESGLLTVCATDQTPTPKSGQTVVALVPSPPVEVSAE
jgi:NhaP-type Na+/H+ or K+/H+ antiporter